MAVFFIVSLITYRYFEIEERGLLSLFWATFFIIELLIIDFGVSALAKIPNELANKQITKISNIILSAYFVRATSAFILGILILIFSESLSLAITPENIDHLRLAFVLKVVGKL